VMKCQLMVLLERCAEMDTYVEASSQHQSTLNKVRLHGKSGQANLVRKLSLRKNMLLG
jgi:hypothetical protein